MVKFTVVYDKSFFGACGFKPLEGPGRPVRLLGWETGGKAQGMSQHLADALRRILIDGHKISWKDQNPVFAKILTPV